MVLWTDLVSRDPEETRGDQVDLLGPLTRDDIRETFCIPGQPGGQLKDLVICNDDVIMEQ